MVAASSDIPLYKVVVVVVSVLPSKRARHKTVEGSLSRVRTTASRCKAVVVVKLVVSV